MLISGKGKYVRYDGDSITETSLARGGVFRHLSEVADDLKSSLSTYSIGFHLMSIGSNEATNRLVMKLT